MAATATETLNSLARAITASKLEQFYKDPKNQAAFEAWKKKRNEKKNEKH